MSMNFTILAVLLNEAIISYTCQTELLVGVKMNLVYFVFAFSKFNS